jgi:hypothetical protein
VTVPLLRLLFRIFPSERIGTLVLSAVAAHSAWHWFTERGNDFLQYRWEWPAFDAAFFAAAMRWAMLLMGSLGVLYVLNELFKRLDRTQKRLEDQG